MMPSQLLALNPSDVEKLLNPDGADTARAEVAAKIAKNYDDNEFVATESLIAEQIFRLLVRDTELSVRVIMADTLKSSSKLPRDIALTMARDVEEVSLPVLKHSSALTETDLIDLVHETDATSRHTAIALRKNVPEKLSETLIGIGNESILTTLIANNGAEIAPSTLEQIVEQHSGKSALMEMLAAREKLPVNLVEKMIAHVSDHLSESLRKKYQIQPEVIVEATDKTRESATLALIRLATSRDDIDRLVQQLLTFKRLTPSLMIAAMVQGHIAFFEQCLAELADVPVHNAKKLIYDPGSLGFRALYNKAGLPSDIFPHVKRIFICALELHNEGITNAHKDFAELLHKRLTAKAEEDGSSISDTFALMQDCVA